MKIKHTMIRLSNNIYKQLLTMFIVAAATLTTTAQNTTSTANTGMLSTSDMLWWIIIGIGGILLISILLLSRILLNLTGMVLDKQKGKVITLILFMLVTSVTFAQGADVKAVETNSPNTWNWSLIMAISVLSMELIVIAIMLGKINSLLQELSDKKETSTSFSLHMPKLFDKVNASIAIEHEADVLLDHNYDGIRELDNNLPPWWKYGFYLTIVYAVVYLFYYHVAGGPTSTDEYKMEMQEAKIATEDFMRKNALNVDEKTVSLADASGILDGKEIYTGNCAACHGAGGEGGVGPNLTDAYWLHGGTLPDVFKSVKYGWPAKGMKSWQADLSPIQMKNVVSYIHTLQGSNPANAKAAQGDLYQEQKSDSVAVAAK